jgi:periplasmic copper chaperone A
MTMNARPLTLIAAVVLLALWAPIMAMAHSYKLGAIEIGHIWAPPPAAGVDGLAVYGPILNEGGKLQRLVGASSPMAAKVRFRIVKDGVENWPDGIDLPPRKPVSLAAWRTHIWLSGLKAPVKAGDWVELTLDFGPAGTLAVKALVEKTPGD